MGLGRITTRWLKRCPPETRLTAAGYLFWITTLLGALTTIFIADSPYERILMGISWGAITITCVDIVMTADVRDEEDKNNKT